MAKLKRKITSPQRKITYTGLETIRITHGIVNQKEMAKFIGISEMQYSKIVRGKTRGMTSTVIEKILNKFHDVQVKDIIIALTMPTP